MARKWTKPTLEAAAKDFNKVIGFEDPLIIGDDTTVAKLEKDIIDIVKNHLQASDEISEDTIKLIGLMGLELPIDPDVEARKIENRIEKKKKVKETLSEKTKPETSKETPAKTNGQAANKDKKEKQGLDKGKGKKVKYTRAQAFCDALQVNPGTITEIATKAMNLHGKNNPDKKQPQLASIEWAVRDYIQPLVILGFVKEKDKKYSLK